MAIGEIILHVGMHKTGTTAIQRTLDGYDDGQVVYADLSVPGIRTPNHGVAIETIYREDFQQIPYHKQFGRTSAQILSFRRLFEDKLSGQLQRSCDRLILSGEAIPRLNTTELTRLRDGLAKTTSKITVLIYVRDPLGFCASMFQQRCKSGNFQKPGQFPAPQYRKKFAKFVGVFGSENIEFAQYNRATLIGGSSVDDFAARVGISDVPQSEVANVGLSADATRCLYLLGMDKRFDFDRVENLRALEHLVAMLRAGMTGPGFHLPIAAVRDRVDPADVAWMEAQTGFQLALDTVDDPGGIDLDAQLRVVSPEGLQQMKDMLQAAKQPISGEGAADMVADLFAIAQRKAMNARGLGRLMGWARRLLAGRR